MRPSQDQTYMRMVYVLAEQGTGIRKDATLVLETQRDAAHLCAMAYSTESATSIGHILALVDIPTEVPKIVYTTHMPSEQDARRLLKLGNVSRVVVGQELEDTGARAIFESAGVHCDL